MPDDDERQPDAGAYIGRKPEFASETIPGGVGPDDERVAGGDTRSSGEGDAAGRVQGRGDEWPQGHREGAPTSDDAVREKGDSTR
jgi:hypothetical protein